MGDIVISMPKQEYAAKIKAIIKSCGLYDEPIICRQGSEVLETVGNRDVGLVICMRKLADMGYEELLSSLPPGVAVLLLTKDEGFAPFSSAVTKLTFPISADTLIGAIRKIVVNDRKPAKKRLRTAEEQRTIDDAKQLLMAKKDMTEPEAFRYMQKVSMDTHRSFVETAQMILVFEK